MFLVSPTEWFYRDRWCHCCVLPGWGLGEGKGEATCPSQPALALPAPAGGFKRSGILHLGILDGASYIPLHLDFFRIGFFFFLFVIKKEKENKTFNLTSAASFSSRVAFSIWKDFDSESGSVWLFICGVVFLGGGLGSFNQCVLSRKWEFVSIGCFSGEGWSSSGLNGILLGWERAWACECP